MSMREVVYGSIAMIATGVTLACSTPEPKREPAPSATNSAAASGADPAVWYDRTRTLDLTNDGQADTVRLQAKGKRPDSLQITLVFLVAGDDKHREEWGSSYELALVDSASRQSPRVETVLRAKLDSVLASVTEAVRATVDLLLNTAYLKYIADIGAIMSKKHRIAVPDFSSHKPQAGKPAVSATKGAKPAPPPSPKVKPHSTSSKSGRRGT